MMNKERLLQCIIDILTRDFQVVFAAAKAAHEAAIHEETVPDNEYDTLSLEASYLAQGQANRAQEIKRELDIFRGLTLQRFAEGGRIRLTALVSLEDEEGSRRKIFLGPAAGGLKVLCDGEEVVVITPESPLGRQLLGKEAGDAVAIEAGGVEKEYEIVELV